MPRARRKSRKPGSPPHFLNTTSQIIKQMDPSQALREDGIAVVGRHRPEAINNLPESLDFVFKKEIDRWIEYDWEERLNALIEDFEKNMKPDIEPMQGTKKVVSALVTYQPRKETSYYKPAVSKKQFWVVSILRTGPGLPSFSKGSQDVELPTNSITALPPLEKGDLVVFRSSLYRQEPEVKGGGCIAVISLYE